MLACSVNKCTMHSICKNVFFWKDLLLIIVRSIHACTIVNNNPISLRNPNMKFASFVNHPQHDVYKEQQWSGSYPYFSLKMDLFL